MTAHNKIDMLGHQWARWTVVAPAVSGPKSRARWLCRCSCGTLREVDGDSLRRGNSQSCGCYKVEQTKRIKTKHGRSKSEGAYVVWMSMRQRCNDPGHKYWHRYGGRGIYICSSWSSFSAFLTDMGEPPLGMTLDRINNDGPYSPENCRWVDRITQANNKANNHLLVCRGEQRTVAEWCRHLGIKNSTVQTRLNRGWAADRALGLADTIEVLEA